MSGEDHGYIDTSRSQIIIVPLATKSNLYRRVIVRHYCISSLQHTSQPSRSLRDSPTITAYSRVPAETGFVLLSNVQHWQQLQVQCNDSILDMQLRCGTEVRSPSLPQVNKRSLPGNFPIRASALQPISSSYQTCVIGVFFRKLQLDRSAFNVRNVSRLSLWESYSFLNVRIPSTEP